MAVALTITHQEQLGERILYIGTLAVTGTYTTNGDAVDVTGNESFDYVMATPKGGLVPEWDAVNQKLKVRTSNGAAPAVLAEFTNAGDHTALNGAPFIAIGQG